MAVERKTAGRILIKSASFNYSAIDSRAIYSSTGCIGPSAQRTQPRARCHSSFDSAALDSSLDPFFLSHFALPSFSLPHFLDSALSTHDIRPAKISSLPFERSETLTLLSPRDLQSYVPYDERATRIPVSPFASSVSLSTDRATDLKRTEFNAIQSG